MSILAYSARLGNKIYYQMGRLTGNEDPSSPRLPQEQSKQHCTKYCQVEGFISSTRDVWHSSGSYLCNSLRRRIQK